MNRQLKLEKEPIKPIFMGWESFYYKLETRKDEELIMPHADTFL